MPMRKMEWKDAYVTPDGKMAYPPLQKVYYSRKEWLLLWAYSMYREFFKLDCHLWWFQLDRRYPIVKLWKPWWTKPSKFYYVNPNGDKSFGIDSTTTVK